MRHLNSLAFVSLILLVGSALAGEVDPSLPVIVAFSPAVDEQSAQERFGQSGYVLLSDGSTWKYSDGTSADFQTLDHPVDPLPVPIADVAFWSPRAIVTKSGDMWRAKFPDPAWVNIGHPPLSPVSTEAKSVAGLKSKF